MILRKVFHLIEEELKKYTEDVMCHADGSISYGFCDEEDVVPGYKDFLHQKNIKKIRLNG